MSSKIQVAIDYEEIKAYFKNNGSLSGAVKRFKITITTCKKIIAGEEVRVQAKFIEPEQIEGICTACKKEPIYPDFTFLCFSCWRDSSGEDNRYSVGPSIKRSETK